MAHVTGEQELIASVYNMANAFSSESGISLTEAAILYRKKRKIPAKINSNTEEQNFESLTDKTVKKQPKGLDTK